MAEQWRWQDIALTYTHFPLVEVAKRLRPWYWLDLSGKWFLELRYANTVLSLAKDQNAIEIGTKDKLVPTILTVLEAVNTIQPKPDQLY